MSRLATASLFVILVASALVQGESDVKLLENGSVAINGSAPLGVGFTPYTRADIAYAKQFLYMSYAAYCPVNQLQKWDCPWCLYVPKVSHAMVVVQQNLSYETRSYVTVANISWSPSATPQPTVVIAFRGSSNIPNWIQDLKFDKKSINGSIEVHLGFLESYLSLHQEVIEATTQACAQLFPGGKLAGATCPIAVTGHSLGAAIAVLAVSDIAGGWSKSWKNVTFIPQLVAHVDFGCPRVGNKEFSQFFSQVVPVKQLRMVNYRDIVPHLFPTIMDFEHTLQETWELKDGSSYVYCSATNPEDPLCSDSVFAIDYSITNHTHYMQEHEQC